MRPDITYPNLLYSIFQSTHPARDATSRTSATIREPLYFNPRIPRGMRHPTAETAERHIRISIHASREGCDIGESNILYVGTNFNPRIPRGMRPYTVYSSKQSYGISIHASREGCDDAWMSGGNTLRGFQSTHPARDATGTSGVYREQNKFQSTHPARDATQKEVAAFLGLSISIHASREGCDQDAGCIGACCGDDFNPRIPRGMRRGGNCPLFFSFYISIHASREGCDSTLELRCFYRIFFYIFREPPSDQF